MRLVRFVTFFLLVLGGLVACGGQNEPAVSEPVEVASTLDTFVGKVAGTDAFVAVVTNGEVALGYVCDGQGISEWLEGSVTDETATLTSAAGAALAVSMVNGTAAGTFTAADGQAYSFTTEAATTPAGLYRLNETIDGEHYKGGWIMLTNGEQRGSLTTSGTSGCVVTNTCPKLEKPVNAKDPQIVLPGGSETTVPPVEEEQSFLEQVAAIVNSKE